MSTATIPTCDPHLDAIERKRLTGINADVLAMFQAAPGHTLTSTQLAKVTARYGARIFDIRQAGYGIQIIEKNPSTGVNVYHLGESMKAISLWQPWASLVAVGAKRYETRGWQPPRGIVGNRMAICAAKTLDGMTIMEQGGLLARACARRLDLASLPFGAVVAVATVGEPIRTEDKTAHGHTALEEATGDWAPGRFCWPMIDVVRLASPVPVVGKQGLFDLPPDVFAAVKAQMPVDA